MEERSAVGTPVIAGVLLSVMLNQVVPSKRFKESAPFTARRKCPPAVAKFT
jgi:hypothetical protein